MHGKKPESSRKIVFHEKIRLLKITLWALPILLSVIGLIITSIEYTFHVQDPGWPWMTVIAVGVLVLAIPTLCFFVFRWIISLTIGLSDSQISAIHRSEEMATLNKLSLATSQSLDFNETINTVLDQTVKSMDADAGMVFIQHTDQPNFSLESFQGISVDMAKKEARLTPGHCLCGQAASSGQVLFASVVQDDPRCTSDVCICEGFKSVACAPLEMKGQIVGLIQLASSKNHHFTEDQREFLTAVAAQVSVSIENARLYNRVQSFNVELEKKVLRRTSELEKARKTLAEKANQLQKLLNESYRIQEDTQFRIAQDMHDGVTQMIIAALYELQAARDMIDQEPSLARENFQRAQVLLTEMDGEIRRVIFNLHPPILDSMGILAATKRLVSNYSTIFQIDFRIHSNGETKRLQKNKEIAVYRILQAALHNVVTHSYAKNTLVQFDFEHDQLHLTIQDDGVGFDPQCVKSSQGEHLGLVGMIERAQGIGANLEIKSEPGSGTVIELALAFENDNNNSNPNAYAL